MELNSELIKTRLLEVKFSLFRIIGPLWQLIRGCPINIRRTNRIVITQLTIAQNDLFQPVFAINDVFDRIADVCIVERRHVCNHRQGDLFVARRRPHSHFGISFQQVDGFQICVCNRVNGTGHKRAGSGRGVANLDGFTFIKMGKSVFPIIWIALCQRTHTRIMFNDHIAAGANARLPVNCAITV